MQILLSANGLTAMVISCAFSAGMGAFLYAAHSLDPGFSSLAASFIRVLINSAAVIAIASRGAGVSKLWGDCRPALWLWGILGAVTVSTYVGSIHRIGMGEATFLNQAVCGVLITALSPLLLKQRTTLLSWVAIGGALAGLYLLQASSHDAGHDRLGILLGLVSGLSTAMAYIIVSRAGTSLSPTVVMFYWCLLSLAFHLAAFFASPLFISPLSWPTLPSAWIYLVASGALATIAQYFYTVAYQTGPAAAVASVSYLLPVLSVFVDAALFGLALPPAGRFGAALMLIFGVLLPFTRRPVESAFCLQIPLESA